MVQVPVSEELALNPQRDIVIKLMPNGQVRIMAPMQDKIYCLGILGLAVEAVHRFQAPDPSQVQAAPASALEGLPEPDFQLPRRG